MKTAQGCSVTQGLTLQGLASGRVAADVRPLSELHAGEADDGLVPDGGAALLFRSVLYRFFICTRVRPGRSSVMEAHLFPSVR
jgi:hypothetical protein